MTSSKSLTKQIIDFVVHLRWHYMVFILSGSYWLGGLFQPSMQWESYLGQFLNVHLLLFGGATAYNSYWDKDEGPVGGLKNPPKMVPWMWTGSLLIQFAGLGLALLEGAVFVALYVCSMILFWLYSTPLARWKGHPTKSMFAVAVSTGSNSFLMGYLAAGPEVIGPNEVCAAVGVALVLLSMYPVSQIFQLEEDAERGDLTFALRYGLNGIRRFYVVAFGLGTLLIVQGLIVEHARLSLMFGGVSLIAGAGIWSKVRRLTGELTEYGQVMRIKYGTSLAFVCFAIAGIVAKHTLLGAWLGVDLLLH